MNLYRYIIFVLLLLISSSSGYAINPEEPVQISDKELNVQISEDIQALSPSILSPHVDFSRNSRDHTFSAAIIEENYREFSKENAYFSTNRFIEAGLSLPDIIFPFHTFL